MATVYAISKLADQPVWVQLRNQFVDLIKSGHYQPGDQLPSTRCLAAELGINYNTASKVYVNLEHDGFVISVRGRGVFVRALATPVDDDALNTADTVLEEAMRRCLSMGMSLEDVRMRVSLVFEKLEQESGDSDER